MFQLFTLQGTRIDANLEQLPKIPRVHHSKGSNRTRKFIKNESTSTNREGNLSYGVNLYKETADMEIKKTHVFHVSEIMTSPVFNITKDLSVQEAWQLFVEKNVHHMPVLSENGGIIGILSDRDILKKLIISDDKIDSAEDKRVEDIMSTDVIATSPTTDIRRIAKGMLEYHIGAMPVVDEHGTVIGIITRSDILYAVIHHPELELWA
jgi:CBS domain-containing protein